MHFPMQVLLIGNMGLYDYRPYVKKISNDRQIMYDCEKEYRLDPGNFYTVKNQPLLQCSSLNIVVYCWTEHPDRRFHDADLCFLWYWTYNPACVVYYSNYINGRDKKNSQVAVMYSMHWISNVSRCKP